MNIRDYAFYLDLAKEKQGFKYDNQIDQALGFKGAIACMLRKGKTHLTDDNMIRLADLAGIDEQVALLDLGRMKSEGRAKKAYEKLLEKVTAAAVVLLLMSAPSHAATSILKASAGPSTSTVTNADIYIITSLSCYFRAPLTGQYAL